MAKGRLDLSPMERFDIALLLAVQFVRIPPFILDVMQQNVNELAKKMIMMALQRGKHPPMQGDFTLESSREYALGLAFDGEVMSEVIYHLFCRRWSLFEAPKDSGGFLLPEIPMVMWSGRGNGFYGRGGARTAYRILVPMSPRSLLIMHWTPWQKYVASSIYEVSAERVHELNAYMCTTTGATKLYCNPMDVDRAIEIRSNAQHN